MDGGVKELVPYKFGMKEDDSNAQQVRGGAMSVQFLLKSRGAGGDALWIRDPGGHHPHGKYPGGFQDQVARRLTGRLPRKKPDRKWNYTLAVPEHGRTLHCYAITVRTV